jgi:hypothetical protein
MRIAAFPDEETYRGALRGHAHNFSSASVLE